MVEDRSATMALTELGLRPYDQSPGTVLSRQRAKGKYLETMCRSITALRMILKGCRLAN